MSGRAARKRCIDILFTLFIFADKLCQSQSVTSRDGAKSSSKDGKIADIMKTSRAQLTLRQQEKALRKKRNRICKELKRVRMALQESDE